MRRTPVVMGVLSMVFGGLQLLITGATLASQSYSKQMMGGMGKAFSGMPRQEGQPDVGPMFERLARGLMDSMMAWQGIGTVVYDLVVYAPFPILLLWLIGRASAKNDLLPATI